MGVSVVYPTLTQPAKQQLGFFAQSATVDNYTSNYVNIGGGRPCPPFTIGFVTSLTAGSQIGEASLAASVGSPVVPSLPGSPAFQVIVTFTDQLIPSSNGVALQPLAMNIGSVAGSIVVSSISGTVQVNLASQSGTLNVQFPSTQNVSIIGTAAVSISSGSVSIAGTPNINILSQSVNINTQQPQTNLGTVVVGAGPANANGTFTVPTGTHTIGIAIPQGNGGVDTLSVTGVTTGVIYLNIGGGAGLLRKYFVSPVLSVIDTQVTIAVSTLAGHGPTTVYVAAILDTEGVFIFDNGGEPASVVLTDSGNNPLSTGLSPQSSLNGLLTIQRNQAYDSTGVSAPATGSQATVTLAAQSAARYKAALLVADLNNSAAAAAGVHAQLLDGVTVIFDSTISITAVAGVDSRIALSDVGYQGSINTSMTWKFGNGGANINESVNIGAYISASAI